VGLTNLNRQCQAVHSTVGMEKTKAMANKIRDINPDCVLGLIPEKYEADSRERFFTERYDYIVDAIDLVSCKLDLILSCRERGIPVISALGTGNKKDASLLRIDDISRTSGCALARVMRRELRARGVEHHPVVFSPEEPLEPAPLEAPPPGRRSVPGSLVWVPATAGLLLCQHVVLTLIGR
jgi:tRNA A37 threonylcarbamoyladenosine dehydratase